MKNKVRLFSFEVLARALVVCVIVISLALILANPLKEYMNTQYIVSDSKFWREIFYFVSLNRKSLVMLACVVCMFLFSSWILRPVFNKMGTIIGESVKTEKLDTYEEYKEIKLPKGLHNLEEELNRINKELSLWQYTAKESERRKGELVAYIAHDIRTPLTSVLGYMELMDECKELNEEQREKYISLTLRKARRIQILTEELFEITRYNISQIELEKKKIKPDMLVLQLIEELEEDINKKEINVQVKSNENMEIYADAQKLARALENIMKNSIYYSPEKGNVIIELFSEEVNCNIKITNTGVEISKEKLERVFEKFYRGDEARKSNSSGSGLGLAIAKDIINAHGGQITAKSENKITSFIIKLPMQ